MSTLDNTALVEPNRIPLHRRIAEILSEKGGAYSIRAFADRIGMNREKLRLMIAGARRISPSELEQISNGIGLSVERIKQLDTIKKENELTSLLHAKSQTKVMLMRAEELANELVDLAVGATERGISLNNLGRVQYLQQQYNQAHDNWLRSFEYAQKVHLESSDSHLLHLVSANLMLTYIIRKDFSNIEFMLELVDSVFSENSRAMGLVHYTRMKMHEARGDFELAKTHAALSLQHYEQSFDNKQIGIAKVNLAYFEYLLKNYHEAANLLPSAISLLMPYDYHRIFAVNEYAKTLIKCGEHEAAGKLIDDHLESSRDYSDLHAKLLIAYSVAKNNPAYAKSVCEDTRVNIGVRYLACKCLMQYYSKIDDAESVLIYYKRARIYSEKERDFFE